MHRIYLLFINLLLVAQTALSQHAADSIPNKDTLQRIDSSASIDTMAVEPDSMSMRPHKDTGWALSADPHMTIQVMHARIMDRHPYLGFGSLPVVISTGIHEFKGKELVFYVLLLLVIFYAFMRILFPKYFNDLFRLFFRTTIKQRQIREQLMQTPLPSLLMNGFFVVMGGIYVSFILQHYDRNPVGSFWLMALYAALVLSVIYFIKFLGLKVSGWIFNMKEIANSYIFVVFVVNKMLGMLFLPFIVLLAFTRGNIYPVVLTLSFCTVGALIAYRFILSYTAVRNQVRVNPFHFFLYLIAFEVAPLLLIYKGLLLFLKITA